MILKKNILTFFTFFCVLPVLAQQNNSARKGMSLSINLPGIIDIFDANLTAGAEFPIGKRLSVGVDAGYIYSSVYFSWSAYTSGYIIRPFIRYYTDKKEEVFVQAQLHYKYVNYQKEGWVDRDLVNGVPSYSEFSVADNIKKAMGLHLLVGGRQKLYSKTSGLFIEETIGFGVRYKTQDFPLRNTSSIRLFNDNKTSYFSPVLLMNVKLGYKF